MKIKLISLNLYEGGLFFDKILDFLKQENADILCFQEVYDSKNKNLPLNRQSLEILKKSLPNYHYHYSPELLCITAEGKINLGNAIFSRYPITEKNTYFFGIPYGEYEEKPKNNDWSKDPINLQHAKIEINEKTLNIFNTHGIWGLDGGDNDRRLKMSEIIVNKIRDKQHIILGGDFNIKPNTQTIKNIEKYLTNIFKNELTTSFNLKRKDLEKFPGYATAVVDMIFTSPDIKVISKKVPLIDISDHLPLVCEFEI